MTPHPLREVDGSWLRREPPLAAVAVVGVGAVAARLAEAAHERLRGGAELRAIVEPGHLVVLGAEHDLPWTDGARYLGWDGRALTLTTHRVLPAADLWRDAAIAQEGGDPGALVVVLPEQILVAAMPVRPVDPDALAAVFALTVAPTGHPGRTSGSATVNPMKRAMMSTTTPETLPAR
jgi:hypothetical protein